MEASKNRLRAIPFSSAERFARACLNASRALPDPAASRAGRITQNWKANPPTMAIILIKVSQRSTGSSGDCSRGWSPSAGKTALLIASPMEKTYEPRTLCPSTVETLVQATV